MSKKEFIRAGLGALLGENKTKQKEPIRTKTVQIREAKSSAERGCKEGETRATFIVNKETLEKLYAISYWDRVTMKDLILPALGKIVADYERKSGAVKPIPKKKA